MSHPIYRVMGFEIAGPYTLRVLFDDGTEQVIDFRPVLEGPLYGPLQDEALFRQVAIDPEAHTLVWPNGADFDPETLHDWPKYVDDLKRRASRWAASQAQAR
ncbi:MAG: DUF2442 domain-containing protein [Thermoflexus sp.]|jgi:hypothetical protein|nr:DUF2442 domain-containing protein [Thermoflexus sp.]